MAIKFIYTPIFDENKSQFLIKNKAERKYYVIDCFTKSNFKKKIKEDGESSLNNGKETVDKNIVGYTALKQARKEDDERQKFIAANNEYVITDKKTPFRKVTKYICVTEENEVIAYNSEQGVTKTYGNQQANYIAKTRFSLFPLLPLLLLLLLLLCIVCGMKNCQRELPMPEAETITQTEQTTEVTAPEMHIDDDVIRWNGEIPGKASEQEEDYIDVPGYTDVKVNVEHPNIALLNPSGNTVYFKYIITSADGSKLLFKTDLIPEGMCIEWDAKSVLSSGKYDLSVKILTYDVDTGYPCTPVFIKLPVTVE